MVSKDELNKKLDLILSQEKTILENENKILGIENKIEILEETEINEQGEELSDEELALKEIKKIETEFKKSSSNPLKKITQKDIMKGFVGAFFGVVGHFAFAEGKILSTHLTFLNSTLLYIIAFIIINIMLYYTGFRKIEKQVLFKFMPLRAITIYLVSILTIIFVYLLFGEFHDILDINELYNLVAANIIIAIIGAGTADLIGRNED